METMANQYICGVFRTKPRAGVRVLSEISLR
jgi:hypothetical protein